MSFRLVLSNLKGRGELSLIISRGSKELNSSNPGEARCLKLKPTIWWRIQVPEDYTFWGLHVAITDAMG